MPNIRILAQAVLKISCKQVLSIAIMAESKGHYFAILAPTEKTLIFVLMPYVKFQASKQMGFQDTVGT